MKKKFMVFGVIAAMVLGLVGCAAAPPPEKVDEVYSAVLALQDSVDAYAASRAVSDVEPESVEASDPLSELTEEDLLPFVEFSDFVVMQRAVDESDVSADESVEVAGDVDTEVNDTAEADDVVEDATADTSADDEDKNDTASVVNDNTNDEGIDRDGGENAEDTSDVAEDVDDEAIVTIDDVDPMGYLRSIRVYNSDVVVFGEYDDSDVDVTELGEYEITFFVTVDRDVYDAVMDDTIVGDEVSSEDETSVDDDAVTIECITAPEIETPQIIGIAKTVRVVDEVEYSNMVDAGDVEEIITWTAVPVVWSEDAIGAPEGNDIDVATTVDTADADDFAETVTKADPTTTSGGNDSSDVGRGTTNTPVSTSGNNSSGTSTSTTTQPTHTHNWIAKTIHHDETGHYETSQVQTGTQTVQTGTRTVVDSSEWTETVGGGIKCLVCGTMYSSAWDWSDNDQCPGGAYTIVEGTSIYHPAVTHDEPVYSEQPVYETASTYVVDSAAWDETVTVCSVCGITR